jgi:hypothetical protein
VGCSAQPDWHSAFKTYLGVTAIANLARETLQLPLCTIWTTGTRWEQAFAVMHCTAGDMLVALSALVAALLLTGARDWPQSRFIQIALLTIGLGAVYTAFSEWFNVAVRRSWAYSEWMPVISLGPLRLGLSPLSQRIVIPMLAFWAARSRVRRPAAIQPQRAL